jgi:hypothetical protein
MITTRPNPAPAGAAERRHRRTARTGHGATLETVIGGTWEALLDYTTVTCPICAGPMRQHRPGTAACHTCGTRLT